MPAAASSTVAHARRRRDRARSHPDPRSPSRAWRRWRIVGALLFASLLVGGVDLIDWSLPGGGSNAETVLPPLVAVTPTVVPSSSPPSPTGRPVTEAPPVLSLSGDFPSAGPGTFEFADTGGEILGEAGTIRRFRVAIEDGAGEDMDEFVAFVDETLGDARGWTASGQLRFQRVPSGDGHDFTVYLVTGETAARMCGAIGLDIRIDGVPYTSCRAGGQVILNLNRWRLSVPGYVETETPLETYRQMVLNHEVGHELGHNHERCPTPGAPATVMQQQTLRLDGCEPYPWPYLDGERYAGPPAY